MLFPKRIITVIKLKDVYWKLSKITGNYSSIRHLFSNSPTQTNKYKISNKANNSTKCKHNYENSVHIWSCSKNHGNSCKPKKERSCISLWKNSLFVSMGGFVRGNPLWWFYLGYIEMVTMRTRRSGILTWKIMWYPTMNYWNSNHTISSSNNL